MSKTIILKLSCAVAIAGQIVTRGSLVEVTESEARDLLNRGKATLHTNDPESGEVVTSSGVTDVNLHPGIVHDNEDQAAAKAAAEAEAAAKAAAKAAAGTRRKQ